VTALLLLAGTAQAGDFLLSAGLSTTPSTTTLIVPSWRAGWVGDHLAVWGTAAYASFKIDLGEDFEPRRYSGFALRPRAGARWAFGEGALQPYVAGNVATAVFSIKGGEEDLLEEEADIEGKLPIALAGGGGLRTGLTEAIFVSAEFGVDWESARFVEDGTRITSLGAVATTAALHLDFQL
jgi:hypothetical protein